MVVFLVGYMGCGKSSLGRRLAQKLSYRFTDMDNDIEAGEGMSIAEIFAQRGETYFREKERAMLERYLNMDSLIVATGGGMPCQTDNMERMNRGGMTVYMKMSPARLVTRLQGAGRAKRPLIAGMDDAQLLCYISEKLPERECFYAKSKLTIDCEGCSDDYIVDHVVDYLRRLDNK